MRIFFIHILLFATFSIQAQTDFFVFLNTNPDRDSLSKEEVRDLQEGHMDNISRLYQEGVILAAGPFKGGGGMFIMQGKDQASIHEELQTDPAIAAGRFHIEVFPFHMNVDSICKQDSNFKMTTYFFVRYRSGEDTTGMEPDALKQLQIDHYKFLTKPGDQTDPVVFGFFNADNEGILIFDAENETEATRILAGDPALEKRYLVPELKEIRIAKGTFCED